MGWLDELAEKLAGRQQLVQLPPPALSATDDVLAAIGGLQRRLADTSPAIRARVSAISATVGTLLPELDRLGAGSEQAHTIVATGTSYLPEAVGAYLRLPRQFADRTAVHEGKTSLMVLCDQLDLLRVTLDGIADAIARQDANALIVHGEFLAAKFAPSQALQLPESPPAAGNGSAPAVLNPPTEGP